MIDVRNRRAALALVVVFFAALAFLYPLEKDAAETPPDELPGQVDKPIDRIGLLIWANRWAGVPYKWGGNTAEGVDCSGLVELCYADLLHVELPRTAHAQMAHLTPVEWEDRRPGDLVYFHSATKNDDIHAGILTDSLAMVHASSHGVRLSSITPYYWLPRVWAVRRLPVLFSPLDVTQAHPK